MIISTREDAKQRGGKHYFTGKACRNGHISIRRTISNQCLRCGAEQSLRYYKGNKEKTSITNKLWVERNPNKVKEIKSRYISNNPEKRKQSVKRWSANNRDICTANLARYRARKKNAEPTWLSETQRLEIDTFYKIAKWYDEPMHVDHIVPLQGENVCGLHVPWNLQLLTKSENSIKSNKHEP